MSDDNLINIDLVIPAGVAAITKQPPATEKQLKLLDDMRIYMPSIPEPRDIAHASELIEKHMYDYKAWCAQEEDWYGSWEDLF